METIVIRWILVKRLNDPQLLQRIHRAERDYSETKSDYLFSIGINTLQKKMRDHGGFWPSNTPEGVKKSENERFEKWAKSIAGKHLDYWDYFESLKSNLDAVHKIDLLVLNGDFSFEAGAGGSILSRLKNAKKERSFSEPSTTFDEEVPF